MAKDIKDNDRRVRQLQEAIYRVRWIEGIKGGNMATDEAIAEAVVRVFNERGFVDGVWSEAEQE